MGPTTTRAPTGAPRDPPDDPAIIELRHLARRNLLATLFLSQGVPLLLAGDEVNNSQGGNNNAYCQDNDTGWISWQGLGQPDDDLTDLVAQLTACGASIRNCSHTTGSTAKPLERQPRHRAWFAPDGNEMKEENWAFAEARFLAYVLSPIQQDGAPVFIVLNAAEDGVEFTFPSRPGANHWSCVLTTANGDRPPSSASGGTAQALPRSASVYAGNP